MTQKFFFLLFLLSSGFVFSQELTDVVDQEKEIPQKTSDQELQKVPSQKNKSKPITAKPDEEVDSVSIDMYKIYTINRDSVFVDTTLTVRKEYKMNKKIRKL